MSVEQDALRDAVRRMLDKRSDVRAAIAAPEGFDRGLWALLCDQIGAAALAIPERYGGAGAGLAELHVVLDELGATLTPTPLLGSAVLSAQLLLELGDEPACERLLPRIAAGEIAALAWTGADGTWTPDAITVRDGRLSGTAHYVLDGDIADVLLVAARDEDDLAVYEVNLTDAHRTHTPTMDLTRRLATVTLEEVAGRRIGADATAALAAALERATVALTAEQVGAAAGILARTVAYSKVRVQFGRPIGGFQALKHRMADLHVLVQAARSASYAAVTGTVSAAAAKVYCSEVFCRVAGEGIQLHGGIAITWEHDAQLYFKRAHGSAQLFGSPELHLRTLEPAAGL
jgi:alkylation response protein AidB-like acyl-CoA dehydrogenase